MATKQTTITPAEVERRRVIVADVRRSTAIESGGSSAEVHAIQDRWVTGEITLDDLDAMVLELHPTTAPR